MERNPGIFDEIVLRLKKSHAPTSPYLQEKKSTDHTIQNAYWYQIKKKTLYNFY